MQGKENLDLKKKKKKKKKNSNWPFTFEIIFG